MSNFGWTSPLKDKNVQTGNTSFENILLNLKKKSNLIESDRGEEFYNSNFQNILFYNNINHSSRNTSLGAVFAERFTKSVRNFFKKPVFVKEMVIGLIINPQEQNDKIIEFILLLNLHQYKLL